MKGFLWLDLAEQSYTICILVDSASSSPKVKPLNLLYFAFNALILGLGRYVRIFFSPLIHFRSKQKPSTTLACTVTLKICTLLFTVPYICSIFFVLTPTGFNRSCVMRLVQIYELLASLFTIIRAGIPFTLAKIVAWRVVVTSSALLHISDCWFAFSSLLSVVASHKKVWCRLLHFLHTLLFCFSYIFRHCLKNYYQALSQILQKCPSGVQHCRRLLRGFSHNLLHMYYLSSNGTI